MGLAVEEQNTVTQTPMELQNTKAVEASNDQQDKDKDVESITKKSHRTRYIIPHWP